MPPAVLHWVVTPLILVLLVLLRYWGNRVINRRRQREAEAGGTDEKSRR